MYKFVSNAHIYMQWNCMYIQLNRVCGDVINKHEREASRDRLVYNHFKCRIIATETNNYYSYFINERGL